MKTISQRLKAKDCAGKVPLILLWLIGIPVPVLVLIFLFRGCTS